MPCDGRLDYPGIGPEHSYLNDIGRAEYYAVTDDEALEAFQQVSRLEGIIPALETSHAFAYLKVNPCSFCSVSLYLNTCLLTHSMPFWSCCFSSAEPGHTHVSGRPLSDCMGVAVAQLSFICACMVLCHFFVLLRFSCLALTEELCYSQLDTAQHEHHMSGT